MPKKNKVPGKRKKGLPNIVAAKQIRKKQAKKYKKLISQEPEINLAEFWKVVSRALDTEYRPETTIRGSSGIDHRVEAITVDDKRNRLVLFAAASSPQNAALMRVDVAATMPGTKVIVARPIVFDLVEIAKQLFGVLGVKVIDINEFAKKTSRMQARRFYKRGLMES